MAALTSDVIVDRIRSVCAGPPFNFVEAVAWSTFDLQPTTNLDGVFRVPPAFSQSVDGMFGFAEDRVDSIQIWVSRKRNNDYDAVRRALLRDVHSLTSAIVRDAHAVSGDYAVLDGGRGHAVVDMPKTDYVVLRLTIPVNYEAQL